MLIVTRRPNESVVIGDNVMVTLLGVKGNQCRLGIQAPRDTRVDRKEIRDRKDAGLAPGEKLPIEGSK